MFIQKRKDGIKFQFKFLHFKMRLLSKNYKWKKSCYKPWFLITLFGYVISIRLNFIYWIKKSNLTKKTIESIENFYKSIEDKKLD